jgi:hypothetical protein
MRMTRDQIAASRRRVAEHCADVYARMRGVTHRRDELIAALLDAMSRGIEIDDEGEMLAWIGRAVYGAET